MRKRPTVQCFLNSLSICVGRVCILAEREAGYENVCDVTGGDGGMASVGVCCMLCVHCQRITPWSDTLEKEFGGTYSGTWRRRRAAPVLEVPADPRAAEQQRRRRLSEPALYSSCGSCASQEEP